MTPEESTCINCLCAYTMFIDFEFFPEPLGEHGLAGGRIKLTGQFKPVLKCKACELRHVGRMDGRHAVFPEYVKPQPDQRDDE